MWCSNKAAAVWGRGLLTVVFPALVQRGPEKPSTDAVLVYHHQEPLGVDEDDQSIPHTRKGPAHSSHTSLLNEFS